MQRQGRDAPVRLAKLLKKPIERSFDRFIGFFSTLSALVKLPFKTVKSTLLCKGAVLVIALLLIPGSVLFSVLNKAPVAHAAPSNYLNFQGRLLSNTGALVADGYYNIEFKLYDTSSSSGSSQGSCAGDASCKWVETYYDTNGVTAGNDFRVRVTNGYFSVSLGSRTAFSGINWDQQMWLTMNIGGSTQTATPTYDGEMTPRIQLTAVPLAFVANNVNSGATSTASTNSAAVSIASGNATGTTSNSGNISIDSGTATGTAGTISLGATSASSLILGRSGLAVAMPGGAVFGTASTTTGTALFRNSLGAGGITLSPANPGASSFTLTLPAETGTLCSTFTVCTGYQSSLAFNNGITNTSGTVQLGGALVQNSTIDASANFGLTLTSTLSGGARSTYPLTISQANDATNDNSLGLLRLSNADTGSNAALLSISQVSTGTALSISGSGNGSMISLGSSITAGAGLDIQGAATITGGGAILIRGNNTSNSAFTSSLLSISPNRTASSGTFTDTGNYLNIVRNNTTTGAALTVSGSVAALSSTCTQTSGTCTDTGKILSLTQSYASASGDVFSISGNGTGALLRVTDATATATDVFTIADTGITVFKNQADSTAAFAIQKAGSVTNILTVDTTNSTTIFRSGSSDATLGAATVDTAAGTNDFPTGWGAPVNWTLAANSATHVSGSTTALVSTWTPTSGTVYQVSYTYTGCGGSFTLGITMGGQTLESTTSCVGTNTRVITASSTAALTFTPSSTYTGVISNVVIKALTNLTTSALTVQNSSGTATLEVRSSGSTTNSFIGLNSGTNNTSTGINNTGVGSGSLQTNTTGASNSAIGSSSLKNNTSGSSNTATGYNSLLSNTSGNGNTAYGAASLQSNVTGFQNTAVGASSLTATLGTSSTAIGHSSLSGATSGSANTAVGYAALASISTGGGNSALGYAAGQSDGTFTTLGAITNSTAIGISSQILQNDTISLGNSGLTTLKVGIGNPAPQNFFSAGAYTGVTGTATQSTNTLTATASVFTAAMVGDQVVFSNGTVRTITGYTSGTVVTVTGSGTITALAFRVYYPGLQVVNDGTVFTQGNSATQFAVKNGAGTSVLGVDASTAGVTVSGALTSAGGTASINASSNFNTNINTGSSTGAVNIGNSLSGVVTLQSASTIGLTGTTTTISGITSGSATALVVNNSTSTGSIFEAQDNGAAVFTIADGGNVTLAATKTLRITGDVTGSRPAGAEGEIYYDTTTKQLLVYANGKWQADRSSATKIVGTSASGGASSAIASVGYDGADYVNSSTTSAQTVINSALSAISTTGGTVYLMEGTYIIDGSISIPNSVNLVGSGEGTIIKLKSALNANIDAITTTSSSPANIYVSSLFIDGNKFSMSSGTQNGLVFSSIASSLSRMRISNVTTRAFRNYGMYIVTQGTTVSGVNSDLNDTGIFVGQTTTITGSIISNNVTSGIIFDQSTAMNSVVSGNVITTNGIGIKLQNAASNIVINANTIHDNGGAATNNGIYLTNSDNNIITGNSITDSSCTTNCYAINIFDSTSDTNYLADNRYSVTAGTNQATINDAGTGTRFASQMTPAQVLQSGSSLIKANASSSLTGTGAIAATTALTGTSTKFTTELQVGDRVTVNAETRTVSIITSDTAVTVDTAFTTTASAQTITRLPAILRVANSSGVNQLLVQDNGAVIATGTLAVKGASATFGTGSSVNGTLVLQNATNNFTVSIQASAQTVGSATLSIPNTSGVADTFCLLTIANCSGSGATSVGTLDTATTVAQGGHITAGVLYLQSATATLPGLVNNTTQTFSGVKTFNNDITLAAAASLKVTGDVTANRPASPTEGQVWYDTTTKQLITYSNGKWQASSRSSTKIVAANNSSQAIKDAADYVATGSADQTTINTALTAATGGRVYLAEGTYLDNDRILIPNNTTLAGAGRGTEIQFVNLAGATKDMIENTDISTGTGVIVQDLVLNGRNDLNSTGAQYGIYFNGMGVGTGSTARLGSQLLNLTIKNFLNHGIYTYNSHNNIISGNIVQNNTVFGMRIDNSDNNRINNNEVIGSGSDGMYVTVSNYNTISGNVVRGNAGHNVELVSGSVNNSVTGNTIEGAGSAGVRINGADSNVVSGNYIKGNAAYGVYVSSASSSNTSITGNTILGNTSEGIYILASNGVNISGNTVQGSQYGIDLTASNYSNISSNTVTGNTVQGIRIGGDGNIITTNKVHDTGGATTNNGIYLTGANYNSLTDNDITDTACTSSCYAINIVNSSSNNNYVANNTYRATAGTDQATINDAGTGTRYASQQTPAQVLQSGSSLIKANASSSLTGTGAIAASTALTGTSTKFTTELQLGDRVTINAETRTVVTITSDTAVVIDTAFTTTASGLTITRLPAALVVQNSSGTGILTVQDAITYIGNGVVNASPTSYTLQATGGSGTNIGGAVFTLAGGKGTGTGVGGNLVFQTAKAGSTGAAINTLQTVLTLSGTNGSALFQNSVNSATAFDIQNANAGSILSVDTTTNQLNVSGAINLAPVSAPGAPTVAVGAAGLLTGTYYYVVSYVTASGNTNYGTVSASVAPSSQQVDLTAIPVSSSLLVTARKIYRSTSFGGPFSLVTTLNDNTTTTYSDNVTSLGAAASNTNKTASLKVGGTTALNFTSNNSFIGLSAGNSNTTGVNNTATGYNSLLNNTTGLDNTAYGMTSLNTNISGSNNTAIGAQSLYSNTGSQNTATGKLSLYNNNTGTNNTASGYRSLYNLKTLSGSITATANNASKAQFTTGSTTGLVAGATVTVSGTTSYDGNQTISSVDSATTFTITMAFNTADAAGAWTTAATNYNTAFGDSAGSGSSSTYSAVGGSYFGYNTGVSLQTGADYNSLFGYRAGISITTGKNNVLLGYNAATNLTTGSNNIILGQGLNAASATADNQLNIGGILQSSDYATTGNLTVGLTAGTGTITLGQSTATNTISIGSGNVAASSTQTITIGGGTTGGTSGGLVLNLGTGIPAAGAPKVIHIGDGGTTTGVVNATIGSNGAAAHTLLLQGGTSVTLGSEAVRIESNAANGSIGIKSGTSTGAVNINVSNNSPTNINTGTSTGAVSIGNSLAGVVTLQSASTIGLTGTTTTVSGITSGSATALVVNNSTSTGSIFVAQNNGAAVFTIANGGNVTLAATKTLRITGDVTGSRPAGTEGEIYYDTTTKQLLTYANGKWQGDRNSSTKIVAASNSTQAAKDGADYVANGEDSAGAGIGTLDGDQIEINSALTAASSAGGGTVYLAEGTYTLDAAISIPNNVTLAGSGAGTLIQLGNFGATSVTFDAITNTTTGGSGTRIGLRDFRLDGRKSINTAGTQNGVNLNGVGSGAGATAVAGAKVQGIWVTNFLSWGILLTSSSNTSIIGVTAQGNANDGITLSGSSNNTITGNVAQGNTAAGIALSGSSSDNTVTGNTTQANGSFNIWLNNASNNTVTGNSVAASGNYGIYLASVSNNNQITSNIIRGSAGLGISISSSHNNNISSNKINDTGGAADNYGIYLSSANYNTITGNDITDSSCTSTCYAIYISSSASNKNFLESNHFSGSAANAASSSDAGTGTIYSGQQINSSTSTNSDVSDFLFRGSATSATAFAVQNTSGVSVLNVNTATSGVAISGTFATSGGLASINASSNFNTNINTGTSTGSVAIGNSLAGAITIQSASTIGLTGTTSITGLSSGSTTALTVNSGAASNVGLLIQAAASQSADVLQLKGASGNFLLKVDSNANIEALGSYNSPYGGFGPTATNLLNSSEAFNDSGNWTVANITAPTANNATSPTGDVIAEDIVSTASGIHTITQSETVDVSTSTYNFSVWIKSATSQPFQLRIDAAGGTISPTTGTAASFTATPGWQRYNVSQTFTGASATSISAVIIITNNSATISAWGAMLSNRSTPAVYTPKFQSTTASSGSSIRGGLSITDQYSNAGAIILESNGVGSGYLRFSAGGTNNIIANFGDCCNFSFKVGATSTYSTFNYGLQVNSGLLVGNNDTTTQASADLSFDQGVDRTINVNARTAAGVGRNLTVNAGAANGANAGGTLTLQGGTAAATAGSNGGAISISGANGTATGTGGAGGAVTISGGSAGGSGGNNGGNVNIDGGAKTGAGTAGNVLLAATNSTQVLIGTSDTVGTLLVLDTKTGAGDPTGANGGMYYNSNAAKFRCYQAGAWTDCIGAGGGSTLQGAYTASTGGTTPEIILDATRNGIDIQDASAGTIGATQSLLSVRGVGTATTLGASLFVVNGTGRLGIKNGGTTATPNLSYDLSFGQDSGATLRTIGVEAQVTAATAGNALTVSSGAGNTSGAGGVLTVQSGQGGATGVGGNLILSAGAGGATSGTSGALTIQTPSATGTGSGGAINITTGNGFSAGSGGAISLTAGNGSGLSGNGGNVSLTAGSGANASGTLTLTSGAGTGTSNAGLLSILGGAAGATTDGGGITLTTGAGGSTSGNSGNLTLQSGNVTSGAAGNVSLDVGTSTSGASAINIGNSTNSIAKTITFGGTTQTGAITIGQSTDTNTIFIGSGNTATTKTQTINIGTGTPVGTGLTTINIGNQVNASALNLMAGTGNIDLLTSGNVLIGVSDTTGTLLVLDTKTTAGDPGTCTDGGMYYNSSSASFRACKNSAWVTLIAGVDVQNYSANATWTRPSGTSIVMVVLCGGGGSGGGGRSGATTSNRAGGTGGGGGAHVERIFNASDIAAVGGTVSVTVGAQTTGGIASNSGAAGNPTTFGNFATAMGGGAGFAGQTSGNESAGAGGGLIAGGAAGSTATNNGGDNPTAGAAGQGWSGGGSTINAAGAASQFGGSAGGATSGTGVAGTAGGNSAVGGTGGGSGGGTAVSNGNTAGGAGGNNGNGASLGGTAGGGGGLAGTSARCGTGGGGGTSNGVGTGVAGGNGGSAGGGGGGGGGGLTGASGGSGGAGQAWVFSW